MIFDYFFLFLLGLYSHHKSYETGIVNLPEILFTPVSNFLRSCDTGIVGKMSAPFTDLLLLLIAMLIRDMTANSKHCPNLLSITGRMHIALSAASETKIFDGKVFKEGMKSEFF